MLSVKLFSRKPVAQIRTLALDEGSRTSAPLVRILLKERFALVPNVEALPIGAVARRHDSRRGAVDWRPGHQLAARAVRRGLGSGGRVVARQNFRLCSQCGSRRPGLEVRNLENAFRFARDAGVAHLEEIASREAAGKGLTVPQLPGVSARQFVFLFWAARRRGLALFYERAVEMGLARPEWTLDSTFARLLDKAVAGERLSPAEGLAAHREPRSGGGRPRPRTFDYAPAASRGLSHVQHRPKHQLHERLYGGL